MTSGLIVLLLLAVLLAIVGRSFLRQCGQRASESNKALLFGLTAWLLACAFALIAFLKVIHP